MDIPNWDRYFFDIIDVVKSRSKDLDTKVGCVIVGPAHEIRATGYNSFPRGINDNIPARLLKPLKYKFLEHAERNAIYNSARSGVALEGCTIYIPGLPCIDCARGIIQCGIKKIVYDNIEWSKWLNKDYDSEWRSPEAIEIVLVILKEAGVEINEI